MVNPQTIFVIGGPDTKPQQVRARDVALALDKLESAILATARKHDPGLVEAECVVALTGVVQGSDGLVLEVSNLLQAAVVTLSVAISSGDYSPLPRSAHTAMWELHQRLTPKYGEWGFNENRQLGVLRGRINKASKLEQPKGPRLLESQTTVYGWLYDAGGKSKPRLEVIVDGRRLHVELDRDLAKRAGGRLYTTVGLEGIAYWNPESLEIERFRAVRLLDYEEQTLVDALSRVAAGAHKSLAGVDVIQHFADESGEDG